MLVLSLIAFLFLQSLLLLLLLSSVSSAQRLARACIASKPYGGLTLLSILASSILFFRSNAAHSILDHRLIFPGAVFMGILLRRVNGLVFAGDQLRVRKLESQLREAEAQRSRQEAGEKQLNQMKSSVMDLLVQLENLKLECSSKDSEIQELRVRLERMRIDAESKAGELRAADASVLALKKQGEGFLLEYDRLLEENGSLRSQLDHLDRNNLGVKKRR